MSSRTTRSNRTRTPIDAPLRGRSRQGCWTCRIRRKKCDEQQNDQGLCLNCSRLKVECIGWGERRPEWIRDSERLKAFKDTMKNQIAARSRGASSSPILHARSISTSSTQMAEEHRDQGTMSTSKHSFPASFGDMAECLPSQPSCTAKSPRGEVSATTLLSHFTSSSAAVQTNAPKTCCCTDFKDSVSHVVALAKAADLPAWCTEAVSAITALAQWKHESIKAGCLSYRDLVKRGTVIEEAFMIAYSQVKQTKTPADVLNEHALRQGQFLDFMPLPLDERLIQAPTPLYNMSFDAALFWSLPEFQPPTSLSAPPQYSFDGSSQRLSEGPLTPEEQSPSPSPASSPSDVLVYLTTLLYLNAVINGFYPDVPEIFSLSTEILDLLSTSGALQVIPRMRALFSLSLVGCLTKRDDVQLMSTPILSSVDDPIVRNAATALLTSKLHESHVH